MALTLENYQALKAQLAQGGDFSPEVHDQAQKAVEDYENQFLAKGAGAEQAPLAQGESMRLMDAGPTPAPAVPTTDAGLGQQLLQRLDPSKPLQPQALAIQPATTHPEGDQAAADEWVRGDLKNPNGLVIVYDAPAKIIQQKLAENPQIFASLGMKAPTDPNIIASIKPGDPIAQAYNNWQWQQTADAAAKGGKTAYRQSKAPWLDGGPNAGILDTLSTKLKASAEPAGQMAHAFMMGVDQLSDFGIGNAQSNAGRYDFPSAEANAKYAQKPPEGAPPPKREGSLALGAKDEVVGGIDTAAEQSGANTRQQNDMIVQEHPWAHAVGEVAGAFPEAVGAVGKGILSGAGAVARGLGAGAGVAADAAGGVGQGVAGLRSWGPANALWETIMGGAPETAGQVVGGIGRAAGAAMADQTVREGVRAGSNYAATGDPGTTLEASANRVATAGGVGMALHSPLALAQGLGQFVRDGAIYGGAPGRAERNGADLVLPIVGHMDPPGLGEVRSIARQRDIDPIDVIAERARGPLAGAGKEMVEDVNRIVHERNAPYYASPEGQAPLPAKELVQEAVGEMRKRTSATASSRIPKPVGTADADRPMKGILNQNLDGVSVLPTPGAIRLTPEEAQAYLHPVYQRMALRSAASGRPIKGNPEELAKVEGEYADVLPDRREIERDITGGHTPLASESAQPLATVTPFRGARHPGLPGEPGGLVPYGAIEKASPDGMVPGARDATAGERAGAPRVTAREVPTAREAPEGSRWQRRTQESVPPSSESTGAPGNDNARPLGSFSQELRRQGVNAVYVMPRQYDALHHEVTIAQLRFKGADSLKNRDLKSILRAAYRDRDARPYNGVPGGWSLQQQANEGVIGAAKDTRARAAPDAEGAYGATVKSGSQSPGQSLDLDALRQLAAKSGTTTEELLRLARVLGPLSKTRSVSAFGAAAHGRTRALLGLTAMTDAAMLRGIYPATRALEHVPVQRLAPMVTQLIDDNDRAKAAEKAAPQKGPTESAPKPKYRPRHR